MRPVVLLNALLLALIIAAIAATQILQRDGSRVELAVRRYAAAVTDGDLEAAVAEIAPGERGRWRPWIAEQLGTAYDVRSISVRWPSLRERVARRAAGGPVEATVFLDVDRDVPDQFYRATTRVGVLREDRGGGERGGAAWYLAAPLLAEP